MRSIVRSGRRFAALLFISLVVSLIFASVSLAGEWKWGANYMGQSVNSYESGGYNYWSTYGIYKYSGDYIAFGFGSSPGCYEVTPTGQFNTYVSPSQLGCGGYIYPYAEWWSGATSYLWVDVVT